jgi:hypothetical protein
LARPEAQTRPCLAWLRYLSVLAAIAPAQAHAGAWIAPEGGQEIWTNVFGERDELSFYESSAYFEAPLDARNAIVVAPWVEQNYDTQDGWRGEAIVAAKRAVTRNDTGAIAIQLGALWVSHPSEDCGEGGLEARWLAGRSLGPSAFVNVEVASRVLDGGCGGERLDLTAGLRASENWLALGQVFLDAARDGDESVKAQVTLVRFGESGRGIQIGVRTRLDGDDPEPSLVFGLWGQPGD